MGAHTKKVIEKEYSKVPEMEIFMDLLKKGIHNDHRQRSTVDGMIRLCTEAMSDMPATESIVRRRSTRNNLRMDLSLFSMSDLEAGDSESDEHAKRETLVMSSPL